MSNILVEESFYMSTSDACIIDLTPPTFSGINFLDVESRGQIRAGWNAATDPNTPIRYEVYIQVSTATGLFNTVNIVGITDKLQLDIFTMPDGSFLLNGATYYVGVRAIDALSNRDSNLVSLNVISTGVLTSIDVYRNFAAWSIDSNNNFNATFWANKNDSLATSPNVTLGTASYSIYDKFGVIVPGMSQTGIAANAQGLYVITPVASNLDEKERHYSLKVTISVDGEDRVNFINIDDTTSTFKIDGSASLDITNSLIGSFWITQNEQIVTSNLGTASFQVYTSAGDIVPGLSETGLTADGNGFFSITPFPLPPTLDTTVNYVVRLTVLCHGVTRSTNIVIQSAPVVYTCKAAFSINALNQLQASFWATNNDVLVDPSILGTASYQVYDKNGTIVAGLGQTGILPDTQGLFHTTPISAVSITDLNHYNIRVSVVVAGRERIAFKGITLLGT